MIAVLVLDDHELVRRGLVAYIAGEPDMRVVAEAATVAQARTQLGLHQPDVALVDLVLGTEDGLALSALTAAVSPRTRLIALTGFGEAHRVRRVLDAGFAGYILKTAAADEVVAAIRRVAQGQVALDPAVTAPVVAGAAGMELTGREREVLALIAQGASNAEIAAALSIGEKTVKTHVSNLLAKAGAPDRTRLAVWAIREGLG